MASPVSLHAIRRSSLAAPLACGCGLAIAATYVAVHDPSDGGLVPACPFRTVTGLWCPGCGLTRATHHLLRGHVSTAMHYNALVFLVLALITATWVVWTVEAAGRQVAWVRRIPAWTYGVVVALAVGFAIVRNLPGVDGLRG
jgi:hypothetical protein